MATAIQPGSQLWLSLWADVSSPELSCCRKLQKCQQLVITKAAEWAAVGGRARSRRARNQPTLGHILTPARYQLLPGATTTTTATRTEGENGKKWERILHRHPQSFIFFGQPGSPALNYVKVAGGRNKTKTKLKTEKWKKKKLCQGKERWKLHRTNAVKLRALSSGRGSKGTGRKGALKAWQVHPSLVH